MFHPFQVEQFLSENEQNVRFNFSESGVHPLTLGEFFNVAGIDGSELAQVSLNYPRVEGDLVLRQRICALYEDVGPDNVLVTVGASEANHLVASTLLADGGEVVAMRPTYQQLTGNALNLGIKVKTVALVEDNNWSLDLAELDESVGPNTKLISIVNPHNPTGHILTDEEMKAVISAAARVGAWIVADEVYAGTERERADPARSFVGNYDRVIGINSMSKAYGLPGLRLGWLVAPTPVREQLWRRHEYATISATALGNELAKIALDPSIRPLLIERARRLIRSGFDTLEEQLAAHPGVFSVVPPQASAMSFVRYRMPIGSRRLAELLITEKDVLVIPGDCFGSEHHFRFSSALPAEYLREGLSRLNALAAEVLGGLHSLNRNTA